MNYEEVEKCLDVYTLEEVLELNDVTEVDALYFMVKEHFVELPDPEPL